MLKKCLNQKSAKKVKIIVHKRVFTIISVVLLILGLAFLFFPTISNIVGNNITESVIENFNIQSENVVMEKTYDEALNSGEVDKEAYPIDNNGNRTSNTPLLFKADLDRLYKDSIDYNENLKEKQRSLLVSNYSYTRPTFDLRDYGITDGIYGYVSASSINMKLPIYLGANDTTMCYGAAHMTYTSLPIGGTGTNCVLAGHTGYIGRIFFDNLQNLHTGDVIELTNYWETLLYKVVRTDIYKPDESEEIYIDEDNDKTINQKVIENLSLINSTEFTAY